MWCSHHSLSDVVNQAWGQPIQGCAIYRVMQKLKDVKEAIKVLNKDGFGDVEACAAKSNHELASA